MNTALLISEIDVQKLAATSAAGDPPVSGQVRSARRIAPASTLTVSEHQAHPVRRPHAPSSPRAKEDRDERCREILLIASLGLKQRLEHTRAKTAVVGLSGGLDSTLAVLITAPCHEACWTGRMTDIIAVTMPCFGTTDRTRNNAVDPGGAAGRRRCGTVDIAAGGPQPLQGHRPRPWMTTPSPMKTPRPGSGPRC